MSKKIRILLALSAVLAVAACEPYPVYYATPEPAPLQPYLGPPIAAPAPAPRRVVRHHYRKRHRRVHCRCVPVR